MCSKRITDWPWLVFYAFFGHAKSHQQICFTSRSSSAIHWPHRQFHGHCQSFSILVCFVTENYDAPALSEASWKRRKCAASYRATALPQSQWTLSAPPDFFDSIELCISVKGQTKKINFLRAQYERITLTHIRSKTDRTILKPPIKIDLIWKTF